MNQTGRIMNTQNSPPAVKKKLPTIGAQGSQSTRTAGVINKKNSQNDTASLTFSNAASNNIHNNSNLTQSARSNLPEI